MDNVKKLAGNHEELNWADLMDELLRENFEQKARAWAWRAVAPRPERPPIERNRDADEAVPA